MKQISLIIVAAKKHLIYYPTPNNLTYFWNFGSLAGFCLIIQILSGLFLAMHYTADVGLAFNSVEHIMRDVNFGWLLRYTHANGASMFLLVVYLHIARGLFFRSYLFPRQGLWYSGVLLFILLMATAFLGYVLPWGQMSFWGATVITNLATAIPVVGQKLAYWLWGGTAIDNATLTRFFSLHFLIPFIMAGLSLVHLTLLHDTGSSNPLGIDSIGDFIPFYPYFLIKDVFGFFVLLILFSYLIFFMPDLLGHQDNYIKADALVTPPHIVPEWYFLPFYAILRAVPDKLGGFVVMASSIAVVFFIPAINADQSRVTRLFQKNKVFSFNQFVLVFILLGVLGSKPVEWPYNHISPLVTFFYFYFFIKETRVFISPLPTVTRFDPLWLEISGAGWSARLFLSYDFVYCCPLFELLWSTLILFWCIFIVLKYGFVIKWPAFENQLDSLSFWLTKKAIA